MACFAPFITNKGAALVVGDRSSPSATMPAEMYDVPMPEIDKPFVKWAPLVALCHDALRVLPGWQFEYLAIERGVLTYCLSDGWRVDQWNFDERIVDNVPRETMKILVADCAVCLMRKIGT